MNVSILNIKGIGSAAAKALAGHQLNTVEQLAATTVEQLCLVPGFGPVRAESAIAEARAILTRCTLDIPDTTSAPETGKITVAIGSGARRSSGTEAKIKTKTKTKKDKKMAMTAKDKAKLKAKLKAKKAKIEKAKITKKRQI
jgi:NAD-dependent DNA ligase